MSAPSEIDSTLFRSVFDASPIAMLVVNHDVEVLDLNRAAAELAGGCHDPRLRQRGGELLHCLHSHESPEGCGRAPACQDCLVRRAVGKALAGQKVYRDSAAMELGEPGQAKLATFLVSASPFNHMSQSLVLLSLEDVSELVVLRGLLPICANCKKIRSDQDYWVALEEYLREHLGTDFTHCICPECAAELYPDLMRDE